MDRPIALLALGFALSVVGMSPFVSAGFERDFSIPWGSNNGRISDRGRQMDLLLSNSSGCLMRSTQEYLFGKFDVRLRLVPNNSAGTVTTFYLSSSVGLHDEVDLEFLGNVSGQPYTLHTNVFANGTRNREMQYYLWFDPSKGYHTYTIVWTPSQIIILVDGYPIRVFKNNVAIGVPYPNAQKMRVFASIWNGDQWATQGGKVKIDWKQAPFVASYRTFSYTPCVSNGASNCTITSRAPWWDSARQAVLPKYMKKLAWVNRRYRVYNYCSDNKRFPQGLPRECSAT